MDLNTEICVKLFAMIIKYFYIFFDKCDIKNDNVTEVKIAKVLG